MGLSENIATCHRCLLRQRDCTHGCKCTADANQRPFVEIAQANNCPNDYFSGKPFPLPVGDRLAGDIIAAAAKRFGADRVAKWLEKKTGKKCGCDLRQKKLNRLHARMKKLIISAISAS